MVDVPKELPLYRCHKEVRAGLIASVSTPSTDGSATLTFEGGYTPKRVSGDYVRKHGPYRGAYFVLYEDDYESLSPARTFENGYTMIENADGPQEEVPPAELLPPPPNPGELTIGADGAQLIAVRMIHGPAIWLRRDDVEGALKASEPVIHEGGVPLTSPPSLAPVSPTTPVDPAAGV